MRKITIVLIIIGLSILNLNAKKTILPQKYYDEKKKVKWHRHKGGPYATYMNTEKAKPYTEIYMNLLSIFSKYYTNKNITKKELIKELSFIDYNNRFILEIKRIKGEA